MKGENTEVRYMKKGRNETDRQTDRVTKEKQNNQPTPPHMKAVIRL